VTEASGAPRIEVRLEERAKGACIGRLTIDHPGKLNILNRALITELAEKVEGLSSESRLRALVLSGAGERAFIGGADIRDMVGLAPASARDFIALLDRACQAIRRLPVPVIARIRGYALGAGLEVAASCDLRIADEAALFGMPEVKVGIPSVIEAALLPSLIGWGRARRLLLTGETIDAALAERWGLIEYRVPTAQLNAAVEEVLAAILACAPEAIRLQKRLIGEWEDLPLSQAIERGVTRFADAFMTDEPKKMMRNFLAKSRNNQKKPRG
jgi:enoyl-CoA hydratase